MTEYEIKLYAYSYSGMKFIQERGSMMPRSKDNVEEKNPTFRHKGDFEDALKAARAALECLNALPYYFSTGIVEIVEVKK